MSIIAADVGWKAGVPVGYAAFKEQWDKTTYNAYNCAATGVITLTPAGAETFDRGTETGFTLSACFRVTSVAGVYYWCDHDGDISIASIVGDMQVIGFAGTSLATGLTPLINTNYEVTFHVPDDPTVAAGTVTATVYLKNLDRGTVETATGTIATSTATTRDINIGSNASDILIVPGTMWNYHYVGGTNGPYHFMFNEGTGTALQDSAGNSSNLTITPGASGAWTTVEY